MTSKQGRSERTMQTCTLSKSGASAGVCDNYYPHGLESLSKGTTIHDALRRLGKKFEEAPLVNGTSAFIKPKSLFYELDGKQRRWDAVESHASVGVIIFNTQRRSFIVVRQFRPPVFAAALRVAANAAPGSEEAVNMAEGFTFELCAGILDKSKSLEETASEEIEEETGYRVKPEAIRYVSSAIASSGTGGARHFMFYAEVDESMRVSSGGGLADHGEVVEVLNLPMEHTDAFVLDDQLNKSPGLMFGILWAYHAIQAGKMGHGTSNPLLTDTLDLKPVLPA